MLEFWKNFAVQLCLRMFSLLEVTSIWSSKQTAAKRAVDSVSVTMSSLLQVQLISARNLIEHLFPANVVRKETLTNVLFTC